MKQVKYDIVISNKPDDLAERVNSKLALGWQLWGTPFSDSTDELTRLCQAMIFETGD